MFDPYSFFAFDPEEFSYGIRLWTHGYDLYTPRLFIDFFFLFISEFIIF